MSRLQPYTGACARYDYTWSASTQAIEAFDYDSIDPFRGHRSFDNGEPVGPSLPKIYVHDVRDAEQRWPDPTRTSGDSFWNWLLTPSDASAANSELPAGTLTNVMMRLYTMRPDLQAAFPDPAGRDRAPFVEWFLGQAQLEFHLPWGLIAPVQAAYTEYLGGLPRIGADSTAPTLVPVDIDQQCHAQKRTTASYSR
jgi:hypothetical protein